MELFDISFTYLYRIGIGNLFRETGPHKETWLIIKQAS